MAKLLFKPTGIAGYLFVISVPFYSCVKQSDNKLSGPHFEWTFGGNTYTADAADAYYFSNTIIVEKDISTPSNKKHLEILLAGFPGPGFVAGTYTLVPGGGNTVHYDVGSNPPSSWLNTANGSLVITSKSGDIISGNFTATLNNNTGTVVGTITGTFTNLSIE